MSQDGTLHDVYTNGTGWAWESQGAPPGTTVVTAPSAIYQTANDRFSVFVVGANGALFEKYYNGNAWVWVSHGTPPGTTLDRVAPSAVYSANGGQIVAFMAFARGIDGQLYDRRWTGDAWVWENRGVPPGGGKVRAGSISAVYQPALNRVTVFVCGDNEVVYDTHSNGATWVWESQGAPQQLIGLLSAVYRTKSDRIFIVGTDYGGAKHVYGKDYNGATWQDLNPQAPASGPQAPGAVYQPSTDRAVAFYSAHTSGGSQPFLGDVYEDASGTGAENQGPPPGGLANGSPAAGPTWGAVYQSRRDRIVAFIVGADGGLYDKTYNASGGWESLGGV